MAWTQKPNESDAAYAVRRAIEAGDFTFVNGLALVTESMLVSLLNNSRMIGEGE